MVEVDPVLWAIVIAVLGLLMWAVTNIHLVRTGKAIKADIDEKRAATEEFVRSELRALKTGIQEDLPKVEIENHLDVLRADFKIELEGLESRLATVQIDAAPIMEKVTDELIPAVQEKVENVKSVLLGKMGYAVKGVKALGESVAGLTGEKALEEAGISSEWEMRLAQLGMDDEWAKRNKTAAFGLSLIKEALNRGENVRIVGNVPSEARRVTPPKGFR